MMMMLNVNSSFYTILSLCCPHVTFHHSSLPQSCHDEEDEDGEEVKSFEVGDESDCLSVCPHHGLGYEAVCCCLSDTCPVSH